MQVCGVPLAPDVQYFLDGAVEHGDLDGLSHAALNLLGDRSTVMGIVDNSHQPGWGVTVAAATALATRQGICYRLSEYARSIVGGLDRPHQRAFVAQSLIAERYRSRDLAEILASWNYDDFTVGGAIERWKHDPDIRLRADGTPTPKVLRRLRSPTAIRRYVKGNTVASEISHHARLASGISALPWPSHPREAALIEELFISQNAERAKRREQAMKDFINKIGRVTKPERHKIRKRLARSALMSDRIIGREPTRAFLRGEPVDIAAPNDLIFQIKSERVESLGHGGVSVSLKATRGERLANLCLYFDKTPPLDQLVAIALHVEAGNTEELLNTGNLLNLTEAGAAHPALQERTKPSPPILDIHAWVDRRRHNYDMSRQDRLRKDYLRRYVDHYCCALEDAVWRADAPRLRRFWALMPSDANAT